MQELTEDVLEAGAHREGGAAGTAERELWIEIRSRLSLRPAPVPALAHLGVEILERSRLLRIRGPLDPAHVEVLADPLSDVIVPDAPATGVQVDVFCRPGVTDAEGEMAERALAEAGSPGTTCHAGTRYRLSTPTDGPDRRRVERLLGNPLIHDFVWGDGALALPEPSRAPAHPALAVEVVLIIGRSDVELLLESSDRGLALDLAELHAVAAHFSGLGRNPTDVELQSIALAWSEHCSHKTFRAPIDLVSDEQREHIPGLLRTYLVEPSRQLGRSWVRSAFVDNAGVIAFDRGHDLAIKVETHNHPSALEPYGGAHTGIGGVIRDILAVSAEPVANTDVLCFGPPDLAEDSIPAETFHPGTTLEGVVRGIADYGNNMGIPTVAGAILFHPGYTANPLVYCGTIGIAPRGSHPRDPQPGDLVVLLGGRTGRDGVNGATMSSAGLDRATVAGSTVQIGAPIVEKTVRDVIPHLRDERLYHAITDCGAGGLCSAVGEMGEQLGVEVELERVPLKYSGLAPWEIWLSEAQERMVLAVPPESLPRVLELCRGYSVEATAIGRFRDDGLLLLRHDGEEVGRIAMSFLHGGRPVRVLEARWEPVPARERRSVDGGDPRAALLALLAHPSIASKERVIRRYDHEVQGGTTVKPLAGAGGPSDGTVIRPLPASRRGVAIGHGINPLYGEDPHAMALLAVDEALRNLVAAGCSIDRAVLLDNFCWGDVDDPRELGRLVRAVAGCRDAMELYRVPFVSGKDSLRNISLEGTDRHSIPGTLLITAVGVMPDAERAVTMDLKEPGNRVYLVGLTCDELGGSHHHLLRGIEGGTIPRVRSEETPRLMRRLVRAMRRGLVRSCHDISEGGLAVAAAEMAIAGQVGLELDLTAVPRDCDAMEPLLFGESPGRFLVEVEEGKAAAFERLLNGLPLGCIGRVTEEQVLGPRRGDELVFDLPVAELERAFKGTLSGAAADVVGTEAPSLSALVPTHEGREDRHRGTVPTSTSASKSEHPIHVGKRAALRKSAIRALVLAAPGINCDRETLEACERAGARTRVVHLNEILDGRRRLDDFGLLVLPGGFSYGDHLGAGAMLATILRHRLMEDLLRFVTGGRPVLGICNGFQTLARLGLLGDVSLVDNASGTFQCRWVRLRVEDSSSLFLHGLDELDLPVAHGQGRVVTSGEGSDVLRRAPLRYCDNPNGSVADIAGVSNAVGTVFGMMPHPERAIAPWQYPGWARSGGTVPAGLVIFQNAVRWAASL